MKITSIVNLKGGTGKTTTSVAMIELLSRKERVLGIDNDKQGNLSQHLKIHSRSHDRKLRHAFNRKNPRKHPTHRQSMHRHHPDAISTWRKLKKKCYSET